MQHRRFGYPYLWIESFCIIQDENDDWEKEAVEMMRIYEKAHFSIDATPPSTMAQGFLTRPSPEIPFAMMAHHAVAGTANFIYQWISNTSAESTIPRGSIEDGHPRATTPRRVLYFTDQVLDFECYSHQKVEGDEYSLPLLEGADAQTQTAPSQKGRLS